MNGQPLKIRPASENDYDMACLLYREVDALHAALLPEIFQPVEGSARPLEQFLEKINSPDDVLFIAEWQGKICGLVDAQEEAASPYPMFIPARFARIDNLVVAKDYRRQGVARALLDAIRRWAGERALEAIRLNVFSKNSDALMFYDGAGFTRLTEKLELKL